MEKIGKIPEVESPRVFNKLIKMLKDGKFKYDLTIAKNKELAARNLWTRPISGVKTFMIRT